MKMHSRALIGVNRSRVAGDTLSYGSDMECLLTRNTLWRVAFANYQSQAQSQTGQNFTLNI